MTDVFEVLDVSDWTPLGDEPMGSKRKLWLEAPDGRRWLFKQRHRVNTGDDWAEKVAAEIADAPGIPHAVVELAVLRNLIGVVTLDFSDRGRRGELLHGNDLLVLFDPAYPREHRRRLVQHTLRRVFDALEAQAAAAPREFTPTAVVSSGTEVLVGYLLLDALIGNTDRHHENWGVLVRVEPASPQHVELAPSFDHAASLGQIRTCWTRSSHDPREPNPFRCLAKPSHGPDPSRRSPAGPK